MGLTNHQHSSHNYVTMETKKKTRENQHRMWRNTCSHRACEFEGVCLEPPKKLHFALAPTRCRKGRLLTVRKLPLMHTQHSLESPTCLVGWYLGLEILESSEEGTHFRAPFNLNMKVGDMALASLRTKT